MVECRVGPRSALRGRQEAKKNRREGVRASVFRRQPYPTVNDCLRTGMPYTAPPSPVAMSWTHHRADPWMKAEHPQSNPPSPVSEYCSPWGPSLREVNLWGDISGSNHTTGTLESIRPMIEELNRDINSLSQQILMLIGFLNITPDIQIRTWYNLKEFFGVFSFPNVKYFTMLIFLVTFLSPYSISIITSLSGP